MSKPSESDTNSYSKTWELNMYEMTREPHELIIDDTEIAVSPKVLQNELMCPICLDILKTTMTTKECLHRFCHDCIITALRAGNKECPTCRKKLVSKRSLRRDPNFDGIIAKIYPNRDELDAIHEKVLEKLNKKHLTQISNTGQPTATPSASKTSRTKQAASDNNNNETTNSSTSSLNQQPQTSSNSKASGEPVTNSKIHRRIAVYNSDDSDSDSRTSTEQSSIHMQNELDEYEIILKPHPTIETNLVSKRFLKTTSNATVNHLSRYLWTRLCVEGSSVATNGIAGPAVDEEAVNDFELYVNTGEKLPTSSLQLLTSNYTLDQINEKFWRQNQPIELFYHQINKHAVGGDTPHVRVTENSSAASTSSANP